MNDRSIDIFSLLLPNKATMNEIMTQSTMNRNKCSQEKSSPIAREILHSFELN